MAEAVKNNRIKLVFLSQNKTCFYIKEIRLVINIVLCEPIIANAPIFNIEQFRYQLKISLTTPNTGACPPEAQIILL